MLKLIKKVLKTGKATVGYPFTPLDLAPNFRGKPQYDAQQCIACGACANACPSNALTMTTAEDGENIRWSLFLGRCIFCARCEEVCPTAAIKLSQEFELSLLQENGALSDRQIDDRRAQYETCPACKKMHCLSSTDRIDIGRHMTTEAQS